MVSLGCFVHAVTAAKASDAPIKFRKLRQLAGLCQYVERSAHSSSTKAWNSAVSASSSRLFQYNGPWADSSRARILFRSRAGFSFIGGTYSSRSSSECDTPRQASFLVLPD